MKYRKDFVTNSSSSSYICEICGETAHGMDLSIRDAEMCECVNGHIFCNEHSLERPSKEEMIKDILSRGLGDYSEAELQEMSEESLYNNVFTDGGRYDLPEMACPICQFIEYSEKDLSAYLLKEYGVPRDEVFAEVKKVNKRRRKLYDGEYITYVCQKHNLNPAEIVNGWKEKFGTYENFSNFIK